MVFKLFNLIKYYNVCEVFFLEIGIYVYVRVDDNVNSESVIVKVVFISNLLYRCKRMLLRFIKYVL